MEKITFHLLRNYRLFSTFTFVKHVHNPVCHYSSLMKKPSITQHTHKMIYESTYAGNPSLIKRLKFKISDTFFKRTKLIYSSNLMYEICTDGIEYDKLFRYFQLPDTFQSWFLLMQLHVWMCIIRIVSEQSGKIAKKALIEAMWCDVEIRMGKLTHLKRSVKRKSLIDMNSQFRAALISYDEGLFGDDIMLAAAVWRTLYSFNCDDPRLLENVVIYIRKQVSHLDSLNTENIMYHGKLSWLPLTSTVPGLIIV